MWKISRPPAVVVSIASLSDLKPHSRLCSSSIVSISCANDLASRSNFHTTSVSPGLKKLSAAFSWGRLPALLGLHYATDDNTINKLCSDHNLISRPCVLDLR